LGTRKSKLVLIDLTRLEVFLLIKRYMPIIMIMGHCEESEAFFKIRETHKE
jgi:hypothetical protein